MTQIFFGRCHCCLDIQIDRYLLRRCLTDMFLGSKYLFRRWPWMSPRVVDGLKSEKKQGGSS